MCVELLVTTAKESLRGFGVYGEDVSYVSRTHNPRTSRSRITFRGCFYNSCSGYTSRTATSRNISGTWYQVVAQAVGK